MVDYRMGFLIHLEVQMYSNQDIGPNFDSHRVEEIGRRSPKPKSYQPSLGEPENEETLIHQILRVVFEDLHQELAQKSEED
jgi:hypothetical protein